ncbi:hypothetical protein P389DRAFT_83139 [Cystobasidium minutum MCA 4210]|uniref:uncharacterized protein n=1 Tax=Cystobasidium minutum MCA 4210 TaxID=1397322 RepID=UPI0034CDCE75|eukprot:jgi/Rhomi1/83139/CE83138_493
MFNDVAIDSGLKAPERRRAFASIRIMQDSTRTTVAMGDLTINNTKASFWALPDELVVQILSLCQPSSLLQLSRTCHSFRDILLSSTGEAIWISARDNYPPIKCRKTQMFPFGVSFTKEVEVPLPERFDDMGEPAFAGLIFEEGCSHCHARRGTPYTALQRRLCDACKEARCVARSQLQDVVKPFASQYITDDNEINAWLASVRLHCPRQQGSHSEDLYWLEDVKSHTEKAIQGGRVTKMYLDTTEAEAAKARQESERQWREWIEANRVVNEGCADPKLAGSTGHNTLT